jgi:hypothetical protein
MASAPDQHPLVRKLESIADLTPEERQALLDLPMKVQPIGANQDIVREGDRPSRCCLVLRGFLTQAGEFDPAYLHLDPKHLDRQHAA